MMFIKDGHQSALETKGIQDDVMDEKDETEVKNKAHCVIKMKTQRAVKLIRQADATAVKIGIMSKIVLSWRKGGLKAVICKVSLDRPTCKGVSYDMDEGDPSLATGKIHNVYDTNIGSLD